MVRKSMQTKRFKVLKDNLDEALTETRIAIKKKELELKDKAPE
jgi:hypothetical protein